MNIVMLGRRPCPVGPNGEYIELPVRYAIKMCSHAFTKALGSELGYRGSTWWWLDLRAPHLGDHHSRANRSGAASTEEITSGSKLKLG